VIDLILCQTWAARLLAAALLLAGTGNALAEVRYVDANITNATVCVAPANAGTRRVGTCRGVGECGGTELFPGAQHDRILGLHTGGGGYPRPARHDHLHRHQCYWSGAVVLPGGSRRTVNADLGRSHAHRF
jgi:hypothetical protein